VSRACSYCGLEGCSWETCPERLEDYARDVPSGEDLAYLGGRGDGPHFCDGCRQTFSTVTALLEHDCAGGHFDDGPDGAAPPVAAGGGA
jgi:hypothetical protein